MSKSISQLDAKAIAHTTDLFEVAVVDAQSATGYASGKMSAEVIAEGMLSTFTYPTEMPNMQNKTITGAINQMLANFAPVYDATATYNKDDVVTYNGQLYKANQDISVAEAWDSTHWTAGTCKDFFEGGGGISAVSKIWFGQQYQYDALASKDADMLYVIKEFDPNYGSASSAGIISKMYIGNIQFFPATNQNYDYYFEDYITPADAHQTLNHGSYYQLCIGVATESSANINRDYRIDFNANPNTSQSGDNVVFGIGAGKAGIREFYFDTNAYLYMFNSASSDSCIYSSNASGKDVSIVRESGQLKIYVDNTLVHTCSANTSTHDANLFIGYYRDTNAFRGTLNYFGFKWLS